MKTISPLIILSCLVLLSACGEKPAISTSTERVNPLSNQLNALKKAKNLESEMNKAVQDKLKALDKITN